MKGTTKDLRKFLGLRQLKSTGPLSTNPREILLEATTFPSLQVDKLLKLVN